MDQSQFKNIVEQILTKTVNEGKYGDFKLKNKQYKDKLSSIKTILNFNIDNYDNYSIETLLNNYDSLDKAKFNATLKNRAGWELNTLLRDAITNNNIEITKLLLADKRVNPIDQNDKAIFLASILDHVKIIKLLKEWYKENKKELPKGIK